jgi:hypothetical protein
MIRAVDFRFQKPPNHRSSTAYVTYALTRNVRPLDVSITKPLLTVRRQYYARNERKMVRTRTGGFPETEINGEKTVSFTAKIGEIRKNLQKYRALF